MSGPEHYREAERLLASAAEQKWTPGETADVIATAQVHATLAATAAAIDAAAHPGQSQVDYLGGWFRVIA